MENMYNFYHWAFKYKNRARNQFQFLNRRRAISFSVPDCNSNYIGNISEQVDFVDFIITKQQFDKPEEDSLTAKEINQYEIIKWLIIRKANIKIIKSMLDQNQDSKVLFLKDHSGDTLLHIATRHEHTAAMKYFLSLEAEVNCKNFRGDTPLHMTLLCSQAQFSKVVNILVKNGADLNAVDENSNTFAHLCASRLSSEHFIMSVRSIVDLGYARLFLCRNDLKQTPLHVAILRGLKVDLETLKLISDSSGFNFDDRYTEGDTILHYAARFGRDQSVLEHIVSLGGNWKLVNNYQKTVLHCAVAGCNIEAVKYFISLGADVNARDFLGRTPMHHLKFSRKENIDEMRNILLQYGADKDAVDDCGNSAYQADPNLEMNYKFLSF